MSEFAFGLLGHVVGIIPSSSIMLAAWLLGLRVAALTAVLAVVSNTLLFVAAGDEVRVALPVSLVGAALFFAVSFVIKRMRSDKERIERLTILDRLTQLPNRDAFDRQLQSIVSSQGYNVLHTATASEALRICTEQSGAIDLVVTDIFLTDWRGHELAGRLREMQPDVKFLFVSGDPKASDLVKGAPFLVMSA